VKKACDIDQYGAPPMDGSKDSQTGAPTVVLVGTPATAAVAQGPAAFVTGPVGVLMPVARKGRPARGWLVTAPAVVHARHQRWL
jgi:hypothetical protein